MAREIVETEMETVKPHKHALEKQQLTLRCDDGAEYIFERPTDGRKEFRLARRVQPDGTLSTGKRILPAAVKETADSLLSGKWHK